MKLTILDTGSSNAMQNMAFDKKLLLNLEAEQQATLHFYDWSQPSATYGYFLNPELYFNENLSKIEFAKRPTGGGILFHLWDLTFSLIVPANHPGFTTNTIQNYAYVNRLVAKAIKMTFGKDVSLLNIESLPIEPSFQHFCMAKPTINDIMCGNRKIGGGAQRRTKFGYLHQGSISLVNPDLHLLNEVFKDGKTIIAAIQNNTDALLDGIPTAKQVAEAKNELKNQLINAMNI